MTELGWDLLWDIFSYNLIRLKYKLYYASNTLIG